MQSCKTLTNSSKGNYTQDANLHLVLFQKKIKYEQNISHELCLHTAGTVSDVNLDSKVLGSEGAGVTTLNTFAIITPLSHSAS